MTLNKIDSVVSDLWKECEVDFRVDKRQTLHNTVIRCAFSQSVFDRYGSAYGDGIYTFLARVIGRSRPLIGQYVGTQIYLNVKAAYHPATIELAGKLTQRLIKLEKMRQVSFNLVDGRWCLNGVVLENSQIEKAIREYASVNY